MGKENIQRIPFSIEYRNEIENGNLSVETASGQSVRIICWDAKGSQRTNDIIALVGGELGSENIQRYYSDGTLIADSSRLGNKDLVILLPSPKFCCGDIIVYKENVYEITGVTRLSSCVWRYSVALTMEPRSPYNVVSEIGCLCEDKMSLYQPAFLSTFETAVSNIISKYFDVKPTTECVKEFTELLLSVASKEETIDIKWRKIKNVTTKRTEDNDCVTTETLLVKGWINDDDFRLIEPNCIVNKEMLCIPMKELYKKLPHEDEY